MGIRFFPEIKNTLETVSLRLLVNLRAYFWDNELVSPKVKNCYQLSLIFFTDNEEHPSLQQKSV